MVQRNVMFYKAGGNAGKNSVGCRISLPMEMVRLLGVTKENRSVWLEFVDGKIVISKKLEGKKDESPT